MTTLNTIAISSQAAQPVNTPEQQYAALLSTLSDLKAAGNVCLVQYIIPGRKEMMRLLGCVCDEYLKVRSMPDCLDTFVRLRGRLKAEGVNVHSDTPNSGVLLRLVFPTLDASRLSKYTRAIEAACASSVQPGGFAAFVEAVGGIDKIRVQMVPVYSIDTSDRGAELKYNPKAVATTAPMGYSASVIDEDALEFGDELWEILEMRKAQPLLTLQPAKPDDLSVLDQTGTTQVVLIADIHNGHVRVLEQVPFLEGAVVSALRTRYATSADFVAASNKSSQVASAAARPRLLKGDAKAATKTPKGREDTIA